MNLIKKVCLFIDSAFEKLTLLTLVTLIIVVITQVMTRKLFNFVFFWSEEVTLLLLAWFAFMAIAIGFREYIHLGIDSFTNLFPKIFNKVLDKIISASIFAFGSLSCGSRLEFYGIDVGFNTASHKTSK